MKEKEVRRYKKCIIGCKDIFNPEDPTELKINTGDGPFPVKFDVEIEVPERAYWNLKNAVPIEWSVSQRTNENGAPIAIWTSRKRPRFIFEKESDWYTKEEVQKEPDENIPVEELQEATV